jgi:Ca2+-binding RTX toxin-like protein
MIHELGHALGLAHPHDNGGTSSTYTDLGIGNLDTGLYTAMSYNDIGEWWNPYSSYSSADGWGTYGQIATPMAFDIAALQHIYGANTTYNTGDDHYSLLTDRYEAIWDAGGIDTITAAGFTGNVTIDLNEGTYLSSQSGSYGGYTIAYGANIERAIGGAGNDTLIGNALVNVLDGGPGADTMTGGGDSDIFLVDSAGDQVIESAGGGNDWVKSSVNFTLGANVEYLTLTGTGNLSGTGNALDNTIWANAGDNVLQGGAGNDTLDGDQGTDTAIFGGNAADYTITGDVDAATVSGSVETDTLTNIELLQFDDQLIDLSQMIVPTTGDDGPNQLTGSGANDSLIGLGGDDVLDGGAGDDILDGGAGNDALDGGDGTDVAVFNGSIADYVISINGGTVSVADAAPAIDGDDGTDTATAVEVLRFADGDIDFVPAGYQDFQVNSTTAANQRQPSVAAFQDGGFIVAWHSVDQDGDGAGVYAQRYNAQGNALGSEFRVNTYTTSDQDVPSVIVLNDGGFVVVWESLGQDGSGDGIYGQRYDADSNPAGSEFRVNTYTDSYQQGASLAALSGGGFVVTWMSSGWSSPIELVHR